VVALKQSAEAEKAEQVVDNNNASREPHHLAAVRTEMVRKGIDFPTIWTTLLKGNILVDGIPQSVLEGNRPVLVVRLITGECLVFDSERRKFSLK
jgi:hypothetical protein